MLSNLSIEDEEYLHDLIDEIIHVEGRWDTNERRILFKETDIPLFAHHVREYFAQDPTPIEDARDGIGTFEKENSPEKEAFIEKRTGEEINEMIERVVMETESKI